MSLKIFIDGSWGTTGLLIREKLKKRKDILILEIEEKSKKSLQKKLEIIHQSNVVILCLPDEDAKKTVQSIQDNSIKIIDASSAHRIDPNWCYGFPEMTKNQREIIKKSSKVANVGCYASAVIALLHPLIKESLLDKENFFKIHAISGYSGGGKKLIELYRNTKNSTQTYALSQNHKHIPEIMKYTPLTHQPYFSPSVGDFERGMIVHIPLFSQYLKNGNIRAIYDCYKDYYKGEKFIKILSPNDSSILKDGYLQPTICNQTNQMKIGIYGKEETFCLVAILDNLEKGAAGSAIQNLNLMLGFKETEGLGF